MGDLASQAQRSQWKENVWEDIEFEVVYRFCELSAAKRSYGFPELVIKVVSLEVRHCAESYLQPVDLAMLGLISGCNDANDALHQSFTNV